MKTVIIHESKPKFSFVQKWGDEFECPNCHGLIFGIDNQYCYHCGIRIKYENP